MKIESSLKKQLSRDILAIGSWVMFFLVLIRSAIEPYRPFLDQMIVVGVLLVIAEIFIKTYDGYSARTIAMAVFTSLFYRDLPFTIFVSIIGFLIIYSSFKINKKEKLIVGIIIGIVASLIGYFLSQISYSIF